MQTVFQDTASARAGAWLGVSLRAIAENYSLVAAFRAGAECAAVVKADAYGLGADRVAPILAARGAETFFVAHLDEGIALRATLPEVRIFVLHGFMPGCEGSMQAHGLIPVLNDLEQVRSWQRLCIEKGCTFPAALQFDTGMSRFGLSDQDLQERSVFEGLNLQLVMSHLACADTPDNPANAMQRKRFVEMAACFPGVPRSLAASSGISLGRTIILN